MTTSYTCTKKEKEEGPIHFEHSSQKTKKKQQQPNIVCQIKIDLSFGYHINDFTSFKYSIFNF